MQVKWPDDRRQANAAAVVVWIGGIHDKVKISNRLGRVCFSEAILREQLWRESDVDACDNSQTLSLRSAARVLRTVASYSILALNILATRVPIGRQSE